MDIQWLGHSAFRIAAKGKTVLIDPWFEGNPAAPAKLVENLGPVDNILVTHGHGDHLGDTLAIAKATGARVVCIAEIAHWLGAHGHSNVVGMNKGGTVEADGFAFSMVHALHSSALFGDDGNPIYMGDCAGFVIKAGRWSVYHAGDTALFSDMALIQRLYNTNVGLLPIGGHYTMDARAAAIACNEFLDLEIVIPMHFKTFPVLAESGEDFRSLVKRGRVEVLEPGGTLTL